MAQTASDRSAIVAPKREMHSSTNDMGFQNGSPGWKGSRSGRIDNSLEGLGMPCYGSEKRNSGRTGTGLPMTRRASCGAISLLVALGLIFAAAGPVGAEDFRQIPSVSFVKPYGGADSLPQTLTIASTGTQF